MRTRNPRDAGSRMTSQRKRVRKGEEVLKCLLCADCGGKSGPSHFGSAEVLAAEEEEEEEIGRGLAIQGTGATYEHHYRCRHQWFLQAFFGRRLRPATKMRLSARGSASSDCMDRRQTYHTSNHPCVRLLRPLPPYIDHP